jgi:hypothetical protein
MPAVLKSVHSNPASMVMCMSNSTSESQDEDSMLMCLSTSQLQESQGVVQGVDSVDVSVELTL